MEFAEIGCASIFITRMIKMDISACLNHLEISVVITFNDRCAEVVELVDTQDSESCAFTGVEVRIFSSAPFFYSGRYLNYL